MFAPKANVPAAYTILTNSAMKLLQAIVMLVCHSYIFQDLLGPPRSRTLYRYKCPRCSYDRLLHMYSLTLVHCNSRGHPTGPHPQCVAENSSQSSNVYSKNKKLVGLTRTASIYFVGSFLHFPQSSHSIHSGGSRSESPGSWTLIAKYSLAMWIYAT